ncbi:MAG: phosphotransferase [Acidimicrobiales bacterium]
MDPTADSTKNLVLARCQGALESWRGLSIADMVFASPKGFSSFTMGVRAPRGTEPEAVLYRHLETKENAILDGETEREVFLLLGQEEIAAACLHYDTGCRIEQFYEGRSLQAADVFDPRIQRGIAAELHRLHNVMPPSLPEERFCVLMHRKWGPIARRSMSTGADVFPAHEAALLDDLTEMFTDATLAKVQRCLPDRPPVFCHNDTYHGNVMALDDGSIKLLDFEFSCLNHIAFDFANLFAETVMEHGLDDPPYFRINEPRFTESDLASLIGFYLNNEEFSSVSEREEQLDLLVSETRRALLLSDYMYAMAALPLAIEPIQKIRFVPYAHQRFQKFIRDWDREFGA